jgi:hypothetical protein
VKYFLFTVAVLLAGCEERFRYECQNPKHWDKSECQRPVCAVQGMCPDQLTRPEERATEIRP